MKLNILEFAALEIADAKEYYNLQQSKLGERFKKDVQNAIDTILSFPQLYPEVSDSLRRCILHRFPYSIFYTIENDTIIILSVAHQRRKPYYWVEEQ